MPNRSVVTWIIVVLLLLLSLWGFYLIVWTAWLSSTPEWDSHMNEITQTSRKGWLMVGLSLVGLVITVIVRRKSTD